MCECFPVIIDMVEPTSSYEGDWVGRLGRLRFYSAISWRMFNSLLPAHHSTVSQRPPTVLGTPDLAHRCKVEVSKHRPTVKHSVL